MNDIIAIKSSAGSYFEVGKNSNGYYLKNRYTEIPNEFQYYDAGIEKRYFEKLCERIPDCEEVSYPSGRPNSCMYVIYADGTVRLLKEQEGIGKSIGSCTYDVACYSEFFPLYTLGQSELLTTHHLRDVCREGKESFDYLFQALIDIYEDDEIDVMLEPQSNGSAAIKITVYGITSREITITEDGSIAKTGGVLFVELLKKHHVRIVSDTCRFMPQPPNKYLFYDLLMKYKAQGGR